MNDSDRKQLVSDVKSLQKITRSLERSAARIGTANDTKSWRVTLKAELQNGVDLASSIRSADRRIRAESIDAQADKLLQQNDPIIRKFKEIKSQIDSKLAIHDPVHDSAYDESGLSSGGTGNSGYDPPQQQQAQIEEMGLISMEADINHLEEQNIAVKKIAEDVVELKEAFTDLNTLVEDQGDLITNIEENTGAALEQVKAGKKQLEIAEQHQVSARKKQLIIFCCCIIIFGIVFGFLGGFGVFN